MKLISSLITSIISSIDDLPETLNASLSAEEREFIKKIKGSRGLLPFAVSRHFASLAEPRQDDPIRRQFIPDPREALGDPFSLDDPLGEARYRLTPRLIHQYADRALLLAGGSCAGYCRYCFRRVRMSGAQSFISAEELEPVLSCLGDRPGIREILISGGDPLSAEDAELEELFAKLRSARPGIAIRVCSRFPVTNPLRISPGTIALLARFKPLRVVTHTNHPRELSPASRSVCTALTEAGIPVLVQTVLLRGINDNAETLAALFRECLGLGLSPYYLFQLDLAPGIAHFRVPLREGLAIYRDFSRLFANPALPVYAVDLPGGGGKIRLHEGAITGERDRPGGKVYLLKGPDGNVWEYPVQ